MRSSSMIALAFRKPWLLMAAWRRSWAAPRCSVVMSASGSPFRDLGTKCQLKRSSSATEKSTFSLAQNGHRRIHSRIRAAGFKLIGPDRASTAIPYSEEQGRIAR